MPAPSKNEKASETAADDEEDNKPIAVLDEADIALLKTYGLGPYTTRIKTMEKDLKALAKNVNTLCGTYINTHTHTHTQRERERERGERFRLCYCFLFVLVFV